MDRRLLVRIYNVGLGDCIYLRVPDVHDKVVHVLIDCGNKFSDLQLLKDYITELKKELPDAGNNKKRLDLLVVTHPHEDHDRGFEESVFKDIKIERIWLSPAFDRLNPKAQGFQALQATARRALESLALVASGEMKAEVEGLLSLTKAESIDMLCNKLPALNGIQPLFVSADTPPGQLKIFDNTKIKLKVLGPMEDIDGNYIGGAGLLNSEGMAPFMGQADGYQALFADRNTAQVDQPANISMIDFKRLRNRINPSALAATEIAGHAVNNVSVVLLLSWKGYRLLFPGDAEWSGKDNIRAVKGKSNGSWNVMWANFKNDLSQPVDFLKIGHHGSENATPWAPVDKDGKPHAISQILDSLIPPLSQGQQPASQAVASTRRTTCWPSIPSAALMAELGGRVANAKSVYREDSKSKKGVPENTLQPQRTDLERQITQGGAKAVDYIEFYFPPK